jgi:hypothetical protein
MIPIFPQFLHEISSLSDIVPLWFLSLCDTLQSDTNGTLTISSPFFILLLSSFIESIFSFFSRNSLPRIASNPFNLLDIIKFAQHIISLPSVALSLNLM